ncbi:MAG: heavy-metal-associated domain-containing protein [Prolixibacteraceae bacterium]|nr:heavy-metal-associated domain-containing protein [Prolixibacteraceae bacterium]
MKKKLIIFLSMLLLSTTMVMAGINKTEKFKVYGNCDMCEERIEKAVKAIDGVAKADWYKETKMLKVTFDQSKVKLEDIHKTVAKAGHDTDKVKADDKVYNELHHCCKYRK